MSVRITSTDSPCARRLKISSTEILIPWTMGLSPKMAGLALMRCRSAASSMAADTLRPVGAHLSHVPETARSGPCQDLRNEVSWDVRPLLVREWLTPRNERKPDRSPGLTPCPPAALIRLLEMGSGCRLRFSALLNRVWKRGWREAAEPAQLVSVFAMKRVVTTFR